MRTESIHLTTTLVAPFVTALALCLVLVPACRWLGRRHGCVAHPAGDRWHRRTVPLLGGVAMFSAVVLGLLIPGAPLPPVLVGCAAALFVLGLVDDLRDLSAATKLVVQFVVAAAFVLLEGGAQWTGWPTVDTVLTMLWIVGITNAFNLIDNMDGLCAGVTLIAGAAWLGILPAVAPGAAASAEAWYLALLLGAVAGFFVYNRRPASIFMGDAGSLFLGSSVAGLTLAPAAGAFGQASPLHVAAPLLVLVVPLLDTALVTCTRALDARPVLDGGRDHTSHRLVALGLSEGRAVAVLWGVAAASGAAAWSMAALDAQWPVLLAAGCVLGAAVLGTRLAHVEVTAALGAVGPRTAPAPSHPPAYAGAGRGAEVLLDFFLIAGAYYAAYRLRFAGPAFDVNFGYFLGSLPIVVGCGLVALWAAGAYRTPWRRFGVIDAATLAKAAAAGTIAAQLLILYLYRFAGYSRTVFVGHAVLLALALAATRVSFRLIAEYRRRGRDGERIAFYGAGESDRAAFGEFLEKCRERYRVVGFIDGSGRGGRFAPGHPVLGDRGRLVDMVRAGEVDAIAVGEEQAAAAVMDDELRAACETHDVRFFSVGVAPVDFRAAPGGAIAPGTVVTRNLRHRAGTGTRSGTAG